MTDKSVYPEIKFEEISQTMETIHGYARLLGAIRGSMTPPEKDYWHISLRTAPLGLRTTPIPAGDGYTFELQLDMLSHSVSITTSKGYTWSLPIEGQTIKDFSDSVLTELGKLGIKPKIDSEKLSDPSEREYNFQQATDIFRFYSIFDMALKEFKGTLKVETSPVQLWPHHMDIAFACYAKEDLLITTGFLPGDSNIEEPYFYMLFYPELKDTNSIKLTGDAYWHTEEWQGLILKYGDLLKSESPKQTLLAHLKSTFDQAL